MDFIEFTAGLDDNERRLDKVLRNFINNTQLSSIYKYIRKNLIRVNNKKVSQDYHVKTGDVISIASFIINQNQEKSTDLQTTLQATSQNQNLNIILQTEDLLFINKPYDVLVHGSKDSLDKQVLTYYKTNILKNTNQSLSFTPGPLHRLDKKTTGILAFSLSLNGARWFSENIKNHSIKKYYLSIIQGKLNNKTIWEDFIEKDENQKSKNFHTVNASTNKTENKYQKNAITIIEPIKYGSFKNIEITLVKIEIKTGRTHQIRAQAALHNHPLLGDTAYNGIKIDQNQDFFLHAQTLILPKTNDYLLKDIKMEQIIEAHLPKNFENFISVYF